jgi:CO/xanthine dehydrogenase Mo-binding subunit
VTGAAGAGYAEELELEGMLHARIVRSLVPHGRVLSVDAADVPADCVVLTPDDVRDCAPYGCQIKDQTVLAVDRVRHVGDPVAAVAAPTLREADDAVHLVDVDYDELPAVFDAPSALLPDAPLLHEDAVAGGAAAYFAMRPQPGTNVCHRFRIRHGDVDAGLAASDVIVERTYRTASAHHAHMEPHACVAAWTEGNLAVWTGTQTPFNVREDLARVFGIAEERVRVVSLRMGGSFGAKTFVRTEAIAAALARKADRPVKLVVPRSEEWLTLNRHPAVITIMLGARADGTLLAKRAVCLVDTGAYADCGPGVAQKLGFAVPGPYRIDNVEVDSSCVYTNLPPNGAFRGYGQMQATWASERAMDALADELGLDPLELRLRNVLRDGDRYCTGEVMHDVHFAECLERAAAAVDWAAGRHGKGLALVMKGMQTPSRAAIAVEAGDDGSFVLRCATADVGQGARRAIRRLAAELLDVDVARIAFPDPDTSIVPYDTRTTSSRSTYMMGRALAEAVRDLKGGDGRRGYGEIANDGGLDPDTGQGIASTHWHHGAAAAVVEIDDETGRLTVSHLHTTTYAGRVVDPVCAGLQTEGSMIMGLGTALFEEVVQRDGQVVNANLSDYPTPAFGDLPPRLTYELVEREGAEIHGLGETAVPPVPAAIGNACASLGLELEELPMKPEAVLAAVDARAAVSS